MHELGIAQEIIDICARRAGHARVTRVVLEIGQHALILPDSIRFCFDLCSEGTVVEGATLEILEIPGWHGAASAGRKSCSTDRSDPAPAAAATCNGSPATRSRSRKWRWSDVCDLRLL